MEARGGRGLGGHLAGVPRLTDMFLEAWEGTGLRLCAVAEQDGQLWGFFALITKLLLPSWPSPGPKEASSHQPRPRTCPVRRESAETGGSSVSFGCTFQIRLLDAQELSPLSSQVTAGL